MDSKVKKRPSLFVLTLTAMIAFSMLFLQSADAKTKVQKKDALKPYSVGSYKVVKNKKWTRKKYKYASQSGPILESKKGTYAYFKRYDDSLKEQGMVNPQSFALTPDGKTAFFMCTYKHSAKKENNWKGFVVKYDVEKKKIIKKGPKFKTGHGQAMAYNPKKKELWFVKDTKVVNASMQKINTKTLKPAAKIKFRLKSTVKMGNNLAFDKKGNAYFYTRSNGGWAPKNSIKIYKGKVSAKKVSFKLIMQGLRYPPGPIGQSLGYNPKSNRLYFVDDGEIISVPVKKLGKLKPKHVRTTVFKGKREFEGIAFDKKGNGFFLTNKPYEIMSVNKGF